MGRFEKRRMEREKKRNGFFFEFQIWMDEKKQKQSEKRWLGEKHRLAALTARLLRSCFPLPQSMNKNVRINAKSAPLSIETSARIPSDGIETVSNMSVT